MDNNKILENIQDLDLFFNSIGFDDETKNDHIERITRIIFASVAEKLEAATGFHEKAELPEMKSIKDFYDYYGQYIDRATIGKILEEETYRQFADYLEAIQAELPK